MDFKPYTSLKSSTYPWIPRNRFSVRLPCVPPCFLCWNLLQCLMFLNQIIGVLAVFDKIFALDVNLDEYIELLL